MIPEVRGAFPDYLRPETRNKGSFVVEADQSFNPFTWRPQINWKGFVNNVEVKFVQIDASGGSRSDYDWSGFSKQCEQAIDHIVEAIDEAMRVMD